MTRYERKFADMVSEVDAQLREEFAAPTVQQLVAAISDRLACDKSMRRIIEKMGGLEITVAEDNSIRFNMGILNHTGQTKH